MTEDTELTTYKKNKEILPNSFFFRPAEIVAPDLIGCKLVRRQANNQLLWGVIVETEAYSQDEPGCHGYKNKTARNETLFGKPGQLYVYLTYGIYHCVNIVTDRENWASGVLLRAIAMPGENERIAAGPGLLAERFGLNRSHDRFKISFKNGLWVAPKKPSIKILEIVNTARVGLSSGKELPLRWYLQPSRSISKRAKGDRPPSSLLAWKPTNCDMP